jgi:hypothetical protein
MPVEELVNPTVNSPIFLLSFDGLKFKFISEMELLIPETKTDIEKNLF